MTRLTVWEQLQLLAPHQVERLQVAEISEAFGHQKLDKKMIPNDVTHFLEAIGGSLKRDRQKG